MTSDRQAQGAVVEDPPRLLARPAMFDADSFGHERIAAYRLSLATNVGNPTASAEKRLKRTPDAAQEAATATGAPTAARGRLPDAGDPRGFIVTKGHLPRPPAAFYRQVGYGDGK
jgi:hypothetical protein